MFGILGIFTKGYIFVPLALICSLIALFMGQISLAFIGLLLSVAGLLTSPVLLAILGVGWFLPGCVQAWRFKQGCRDKGVTSP